MQEHSSLFGLTIDPATKEQLAETARWARFLAIVSLLALILLMIFGVYTMTMVNRMEEQYGYPTTTVGTTIGTTTAIAYFVIFLIYLFPIIFMLRFAGKMQKALHGNNQDALNEAFRNLKACFRYIGIVTIIFLVMTALSLLFGIAGSAFSS